MSDFVVYHKIKSYKGTFMGEKKMKKIACLFITLGLCVGSTVTAWATTAELGFSVASGIASGIAANASGEETVGVGLLSGIAGAAKKMLISEFKTVEVGATDKKDSIKDKLKGVSLQDSEDLANEEGMYNHRYTDESALDFMATYKNAKKAHIEFCNPSDYEMRYYTLTEDELASFMKLMEGANLDREKSSVLADFTYTLHLFDEDDNYVYVIAVDEDKKSMCLQPGGLECDGLAEFIVGLSDKATALHGEVIYRPRNLVGIYD